MLQYGFDHEMDRWGAPGAGQPGLQCGSGRAGATLNASEGRSLLRVLDFELFTRVVSRRWHAHCNGVATRHRKACLRPVRVVQGLAVWTDGRAVGVDAAIIETRQRALPVSRTWPSSIEPNRSLPPASAWPSLRRLPGRSSSTLRRARTRCSPRRSGTGRPAAHRPGRRSASCTNRNAHCPS
jgi:hypothetical protein